MSEGSREEEKKRKKWNVCDVKSEGEKLFGGGSRPTS